jgi:geranylgeranyl pyrophosphate synthase|tara:strand:+ start:3098 stop:4093 length:996 start_codon:yes stop_codon:yes gene_type:complete
LFDFDEDLRHKVEFVNQSILDLDLSNIHPILADPSRYSITGGGKRLRPILCMLCAEAVGGDYRDTREAFLALELIHNGTLVHDDIIDADLFRRGTPSVQMKYDTNRAVLTGDALLSLGLRYASMTGNLKVVHMLAETALKMVQGVALQTFFRREKVAESTYLKINYLKSGSLFECAAALGGIVSTDILVEHEALSEFGRNFGDAYQIRDDIRGIYAEVEQGDLPRIDLLNGDISLPLIYALESEEISKQDISTLMMPYLGENESADIEEIRRIYKESGALKRSMDRMRDYAKEAIKCLDGLDDGNSKSSLIQLMDQYYLSFIPESRLEVIL